MKRNRNLDQESDNLIFCESQSRPGKFYYFNSKTKQSYWTKSEAQESNKANVTISGKIDRKTSLKANSDLTTRPCINSDQDGQPPECNKTLSKTLEKRCSSDDKVTQGKKRKKKNTASKRMADLRENLTKDESVNIKHQPKIPLTCMELKLSNQSATKAIANTTINSQCPNPVNPSMSDLKNYTIPKKYVKSCINSTTPSDEGITSRKIIRAKRKKEVPCANMRAPKNDVLPMDKTNVDQLQRGQECGNKINLDLLPENDSLTPITIMRSKRDSYSDLLKPISKQTNMDNKICKDNKCRKIDSNIKISQTKLVEKVPITVLPEALPSKQKIVSRDNNNDSIILLPKHSIEFQLKSSKEQRQSANSRLSNLRTRLSDEVSTTSIVCPSSLLKNASPDNGSTFNNVRSKNIVVFNSDSFVSNDCDYGRNVISKFPNDNNKILLGGISLPKSRKCDLSNTKRSSSPDYSKQKLTNEKTLSNTNEVETSNEEVVNCNNLQLKNIASTRMTMLRSRLSDEVALSLEEESNSDVIMENILDNNNADEMEWETILDEINLVRGKTSISVNITDPVPACSQNDENIAENFYVVVDTNVFISDLKLINSILASSFSACSKKPIIALPWRVLMELDSLKLKNAKIGYRAREAANCIREQLSCNSRLKGQPLKDAHNHIFPCEGPDDEILNYCLQLADKGSSVILLSNDKILSSKALINDIKSMTSKELNSLILDCNNFTDDDKEILEIINTINDDARKIYLNLKTLLKHFLSKILKTEMRLSYGNLWSHIIYKLPPWTFKDVTKCILKHWVAVFSEKFPASLKNLLDNLQEFDKEQKDESFIAEYIKKFLGTVLQIFQNIEIVGDYTESVKEYKAKAIEIYEKIPPDKVGMPEETAHNASLQIFQNNFDCKVSQAFHIMWIFFSSYCSQIASLFNIPISLELVQETTVFSDEPNILIHAKTVYKQLVRILSALTSVLQSVSQQTSQVGFEINKLNETICETVTGLGYPNMCTTLDEVNNYSFHNKVILEEGRRKFDLLHNILNECQTKYSEISR